MTSGIYKIVNVANGKIYVGSAYVLQRRWNRHICDLNSGTHPNAKLQAGWSKYGQSSFEFLELEMVEESKLLEREQFWIDSLSPEYNICQFAGNTAGIRPSAETREKMAAAKRGKPRSAETRAKISAYQKDCTRSPEWSKNSSSARIGQKRSDESRLKMSIAAKGRVMSQTQKNAISAALKARFQAARKNEHLIS